MRVLVRKTDILLRNKKIRPVDRRRSKAKKKYPRSKMKKTTLGGGTTFANELPGKNLEREENGGRAGAETPSAAKKKRGRAEVRSRSRAARPVLSCEQGRETTWTK